MIGPADFLLGGALPLVVAAAVYVAGRWLAQRAGAGRPASVGWSAGVVAGFVAGQLGLEARGIGLGAAAVRLMRASESHDWLPLVACAATLPALVAALARRRWLEPALAAPLCVAAPAVLLWSKYRASQQLRAAGFATDAVTPGGAAALLGVIGAALFFAWLLWRAAEGGTLPRARALLAVVAVVGSAAAVALTGALVYGQLLGALAAAVGGCAAMAWLAGDAFGPEAARGPIPLLFGGLVVAAAGYSDLAVWHAAALGAGLVLPVGWLLPMRGAGPRLEIALRGMLCVVPLAAVLWSAAAGLAASDSQPDGTGGGADSYSDYENL